jgi:GT2 family glycosyltransferase
MNPGMSASPSDQPEVAIVILNWNGRDFLRKFLPAVVSSTYLNKRIIVADNASSDDSVSFLRENFPQVELIINPANEGFAKGYNTALRQVKADYYVLLNSDVEVTPGWIEPIITLMEKDWSIAACQPKMLTYDQKNRFEYAGACGGWIDQLGYPFARGRVFDDCEEDHGQYEKEAECFWASGAALFVKSNIYQEVGGLDEYFFAHQEEIDFCWRLKLKGYKVFSQPASVVYHVGGGTLPKTNHKKTYLNFRNNLIMMYKNQTAADTLKKIPFRLALDAIAAWRAIFSGDAGFFGAVCKAHLHFIRWIVFHQKQSVFPASKKLIQSGVYKGSIVWDYFIRKKKTFSEIVGNK